jgi:hypothetical protein
MPNLPNLPYIEDSSGKATIKKKDLIDASKKIYLVSFCISPTSKKLVRYAIDAAN